MGRGDGVGGERIRSELFGRRELDILSIGEPALFVASCVKRQELLFHFFRWEIGGARKSKREKRESMRSYRSGRKRKNLLCGDVGTQTVIMSQT